MKKPHGTSSSTEFLGALDRYQHAQPDPPPTEIMAPHPIALLDRLLAKRRIDSNDCWVFTGSQNGHGYGQIWDLSARRPVGAHRAAYELLVGPIPDDLQLDHLCRNRRCFNPSHLEPVSPRENCYRGESPFADRKRQTRCLRGHDLSDALIKGGRRECRTCKNERQRRRYAERRA